MNIKANQQQQQQHNETKHKKDESKLRKTWTQAIFEEEQQQQKISKFTRQSNVIHLLNTCVNISLISHTYKNLNKYKIK